MELIRLGCASGRPDGSLTTTQAALSRYLKIEGQPTDNPVVTKDIVAELVKHSTRVCPLTCNTGETLKGDVCIADDKAAPVAPPSMTATRRNSDEDDKARSRRKNDDDEDNARSRQKQQATRDRDQDQPRRQQQQRQQVSQPEPRAPRQQAQVARPSVISGGGGYGGGGGGGHSTMVGVGF